MSRFLCAAKGAVAKAARQTIRVSWLMMKIYLPLSVLTLLLKHLGVIEAAAPLFAPLMGYIGLPGEAAITLVAGFTNSIYAALATMAAFDLTPRQVTILGVVLGIAHSLFVETGILTRLGIATVMIAFFRIGAALLTGVVMNHLLPTQVSGRVLSQTQPDQVFSWVTAAQGIATTAGQILAIIFLITLGYEVFSLWRHAADFRKRLDFIPRSIGMSDGAFGPWIVGLLVGITYGAAMLFQFAEERRLSHKDACLITLFLCLAHAMIEDTMLFVIVGGNFWWIMSIRLFMAFAVVKIVGAFDLHDRFGWLGLPRKKTIHGQA